MTALSERLGIIICNYNKCEETLECIESVFHSRGLAQESYKLYVIDNASTDDSAVHIFDEMTRLKYHDRISLTVSSEDLGSCGGINLGMKQALWDGCKYICCLGEAVTVHEDALHNMLHFLAQNPNVGMVGGKVYHKHMPHYIQQYGISIDFKHFRASTLYADTYDDDTLPNEVYCDAISACGLMVSAKTIDLAGLMPEDPFLYWDDTEWGYRIKKAGLDVVALGNVRLYHSASPLHHCDDTKANYYLTRNCLHFFMKYTKPEHCTKMSIVMLRSIYESFYLHRMGHAHNMAQSDMAALLDAAYHVRGRAAENRILDNDENGLGFVSFFEEQEAVYMEEDDPFLEQVIRQINPNIAFMQLPKPDVVTIIRCDSILGIKDFSYSIDFSADVVYIDKSYRMLATHEDARQVKDYEATLQTFLYAMQPAILRRIEEMRGIRF